MYESNRVQFDHPGLAESFSENDSGQERRNELRTIGRDESPRRISGNTRGCERVISFTPRRSLEHYVSSVKRARKLEERLEKRSDGGWKFRRGRLLRIINPQCRKSTRGMRAGGFLFLSGRVVRKYGRYVSDAREPAKPANY